MRGRKVYRKPRPDDDEVQNERILMMDQAIRLVENFFHRGEDPMDRGDAPKARPDLTTEEAACYKQALQFLRREFGRGWREGGQAVKDADLPEDPFEKDPKKAPK